MDKKGILKMAFDSIVEADEEKAMEAMDLAKEQRIDSLELLNEGFSAGIKELGDRFGNGELFLPELIFSTEVMKEVTARVEKEVLDKGEQIDKAGVMIMATVEGDVHDIGKGICCSLLKASGFEVIDLGREVSVDTIIASAEKHQANLIGTSALLTTTMTEQKRLEEELKKQGLREKYKTMIGGAPVTKRWADKIGADAYTEDSAECVQKAKELL